MGRLSSLQVLRAVAALGVLYEHLSVKAGGGGTLGAAGVDVFFVLSGYIVSISAAARPEGFIRNRLIRVLPTYYYASAFAVFLAIHAGLDWQRTLASLTLWPAYADVVAPYLTPAWSLCYEMVFYAALAAVIRGVEPALILAGFVGCWALALVTPVAAFDFLGSPIILEFLAGVGLARLNVPASTRGGLVAVGLSVLLLLGLAQFDAPATIANSPVADPLAWRRLLCWGVPAALLVYGFLQLEPWFRRAWARPLVFLGDASYALYLFHLIVITLMLGVLGRVPFLLGGALSIVVAIGVYLGVEKPVLRKLRSPARPAAVAAE